jgi:hypothetical protein
MTESFPEEPMLPLFADRTVFYNIVQPYGDNGEYPHPAWVTEHLSVEDIGQVEDPKLKEALHRQFLASESDPDWSHQIFVNPDRTFKHAFKVPIRPLNVRFTAEGIEEVNDGDRRVSSPQEALIESPSSAASRLEKILGWLRK